MRAPLEAEAARLEQEAENHPVEWVAKQFRDQAATLRRTATSAGGASNLRQAPELADAAMSGNDVKLSELLKAKADPDSESSRRLSLV